MEERSFKGVGIGEMCRQAKELPSNGVVGLFAVQSCLEEGEQDWRCGHWRGVIDDILAN